MTDNPQWQAPGSTPATPPPYAPAGGSPNNTGPVSASGWPVGGSGQRPAWTPPPKPGLIPLRPLDLGAILGASFRVLRRNPKPTFGAALLIEGLSVTIVLVVLGLVTFASLSRLNFSSGEDAGVIQAGSIATVILASIAAVLFTIAATALLQGIIVLEVARGTLGEKLTLGALWRLGRGRLWALVGWAGLVAGAIALAVIFLAVGVAFLAATLGSTGAVIGVLFAVFGGLGFLAVGIWVGTKLSLVSSALMIERLPLRAAIARSWRLTTGAFWRTFGIQALVAVIINIALQVISAPLSLLSPLLMFLLDPNAQGQPSMVALSLGLTVLATAASVVFSAIGAVVQSATGALIYLDRRIRTEGLDLELTRFVEARQTGAPVVDPYLLAARPGGSVAGAAPRA